MLLYVLHVLFNEKFKKEGYSYCLWNCSTYFKEFKCIIGPDKQKLIYFEHIIKYNFKLYFFYPPVSIWFGCSKEPSFLLIYPKHIFIEKIKIIIFNYKCVSGGQCILNAWKFYLLKGRRPSVRFPLTRLPTPEPDSIRSNPLSSWEMRRSVPQQKGCKGTSPPPPTSPSPHLGLPPVFGAWATPPPQNPPSLQRTLLVSLFFVIESEKDKALDKSQDCR